MNRFFIIFLCLSFTGIFGQNAVNVAQAEQVDFTKVNATITIDPEKQWVEGKVTYGFEILGAADSVFIDARNMEFRNVFLNGKKTDFSNDGSRFGISLAEGLSGGNRLELSYTAYPKQTMYFINWDTAQVSDSQRQVWTQGQGKYTSHWLPSFDDMREKAVYELKINFRPGYEVAANGVLKEKQQLNDSVMSWTYSMQQPMSSYLLAVAAGDYRKKKLSSESGIPIELYYYPEDERLVEPTYRHTGTIFDFLEKETGQAYPWQNYRQLPVQNFLHAGMENTTTTIFSDVFMVDSIAYNDQNYVNVNAHELAHQWFGNFVTATGGEHHWLHEGFATFYALLAEREIFGEDYYYWRLYESAEELRALSEQGKGESLLSTSAGSLTYYQKGAWALHILREKVGETTFREGVRNYLAKHKYGSVATGDFIREVEKASAKDLSAFEKDWLNQSAFPKYAALNSLRESDFINDYLAIAGLRETAFENKKEFLDKALEFPVNDYIGQEVVYQLSEVGHPDAVRLLKKAFDTGNLYVRQAIALSLENIRPELKTDFVSLLKDKSYLTREKALLKLYMQFPGEAERWLQQTAGMEGFSNKNLRMLWLTINLVSPEVDPGKTSDYYRELSGYTSSYLPFQVRENAFGYLFQLDAFNDQNLIDLVDAAQHHTWRFRDFSRKLLERLLQEEEYRSRYEELLPQLNKKDREFLMNRFKI